MAMMMISTLSMMVAQQMTTKVAPSYYGKTSFLAFEGASDDWCDITYFQEQTGRRSGLLQTLVGQTLLEECHRWCEFFEEIL
jgi:hypothetical protein